MICRKQWSVLRLLPLVVLVFIPAMAGPAYAADTAKDKDLVVNINTASLKELLLFPIVDLSLASRIILLRSKEGPFEDLEDISEIEGVNETLLKILSEDIVFTGETEVPPNAYSNARSRRVNRRQKVKDLSRAKEERDRAESKKVKGKKQDERLPIDLVADYLEFKSQDQILIAKGAARVL
ncbi:MAG: helix-hairpin-helix domain-containing protein, partial [bacterium]|nr:helix-hairpin-helix domain-containing protein [bacterium]